MIKNIFSLTFFIFVGSFFIACQQNNTTINKKYKVSSISFFADNQFNDLNKAIIEISNQLLLHIEANKQQYNKIAITSFVALNNLGQTSSFGRVVAESLINELHSRKFKLIDYRATQMITVNESGEFSLTRDINKLQDEIPEALILVGTYSILDKNRLVINSRLINNLTSDVVSTSRVVYEFTDCKQFNLCPIVPIDEKPVPKKILILDDK